jgi:hypothetical protein
MIGGQEGGYTGHWVSLKYLSFLGAVYAQERGSHAHDVAMRST